MTNIKIEKVGDINSKYPYLEVFIFSQSTPFLEIGISDERQLVFKIYAREKEIELNVNEWEYLMTTAKEFLPRALKDEDDFKKLFPE